MNGSVPACAWTRNWEDGTPSFVVKKARNDISGVKLRKNAKE
jgi:hypothetical protein